MCIEDCSMISGGETTPVGGDVLGCKEDLILVK